MAITFKSTTDPMRSFKLLAFPERLASQMILVNRLPLCLPLSLALLVACAGCGDTASPYEYAPINGTLTYEDGSVIPAGGIVLRFIVQDAEGKGIARPRPAAANVNSEGVFDCVTGYKYGDGLIPGKHRVSLNYATDKQGNLLVPKEYTLVTSPLIIDTVDAPLHIKVPKP